MKHIYLCSEEIANQLKISKTGSNQTHRFSIAKRTAVYWPKGHSPRHINPKSLTLLKDKYKIKELVVVDRTNTTKEKINIKDHINRTGTSFLIGATPYKEKPTFPDATEIYKKKTGEVLVCYGEKYKKQKKNQRKTAGEWLAPIALVWNYIGINISAVGVSQKTRKL